MNFWANKLQGTPQQAPVAPSRSLFNPVPLPVPNTVPTVPQGPPVAPKYVPSVPMTTGSVCPGCGSDNYRPPVAGQAIACGDCGWHPRFQQEGYGLRALRTDKGGPAQPARQVAGQGQTLQAAIAVLNAGGGEHLN
jgi:hypothetical protein